MADVHAHSPPSSALEDSAAVSYPKAAVPAALATGAKKQTVVYVRGDGMGGRRHHPLPNHHWNDITSSNPRRPNNQPRTNINDAADDCGDTRPSLCIPDWGAHRRSISLSCSLLCADLWRLCCLDLVVVCCFHFRQCAQAGGRGCERTYRLWVLSKSSAHLWFNFALLTIVLAMLWTITGLAWMKFSAGAYEE